MIEASRVTVTDTPEKLIDATGADSVSSASAVLIPVTGGASVFLGGDDGVTAASGAQWDPALGPLTVTLQRDEELWGVRAAADADQVVHVLAFGK